MYNCWLQGSGAFFIVFLLFFSEKILAADFFSLYQSALTYDSEYSAAFATFKAEVEREPHAFAALMPKISLSASTTLTTQDTKFQVDDSETVSNRYNDKGWSAQLTQPLFNWGGWINYRQAGLSAVSAGIQYQQSKQDLMLRLASAYFDFLVSREAVETNDAQMQAIRAQLEAAKRNYTLGVSTITDTYEVQARFDLAVAQRISANSDVIIKEKILRNICGISMFESSRLHQGARWDEPSPLDVSHWSETASRENLDVRVFEHNLEVATQEIEKRRSNRLPRFDLVGAFEQTTYSATLSSGIQRPQSDVNASALSLQISMPLYSGGAVSSEIRQATALRDKALDNLQRERRNAILNAEKSYHEVRAGLAQIKAYEAAVVSSESAVKANVRGYQLGMRINIDVLNAQNQLFDTKLKLMRSRFDTLLAQLKLKASVGSLSDSDMAGINALFE